MRDEPAICGRSHPRRRLHALIEDIWPRVEAEGKFTDRAIRRHVTHAGRPEKWNRGVRCALQ